MEAVGARLGRSSNRFGTNTTVFSGPVRKWKKDWIPITPSSSSSSSSTNNSNNHNHNHLPSSSSSSSANPNGNSTNGTNESFSHLRFFKWAPLSQSSNKENSNINNTANNDSHSPTNEDSLSEQPPRRKFKYIPIAVLEEHKKVAEENTDDDTKPAEADENTAEEASKSDAYDDKPDINDVPMEEENQVSEEENQTASGRQDLNQSLDLSLGFTSHEEDNQTDPKDGELE